LHLKVIADLMLFALCSMLPESGPVRKGLMTDWRLPIADCYLPSAISYLPSAISHLPSAISHLPSCQRQ
jgi:hypothetical protein